RTLPGITITNNCNIPEYTSSSKMKTISKKCHNYHKIYQSRRWYRNTFALANRKQPWQRKSPFTTSAP
ncbi:MAG: hypothetical protein ACXVAU_18940, partial [Mucilaginibacter sp.]